MWPNWLPLRSDLKALSPYGAPQLPAEASLNTNENPYAPSITLQKAITAAVAEASSSLNRYPDRDAIKVRTALASYINEENGTEFGGLTMYGQQMEAMRLFNLSF
jgi:histidinol-phosphate aminotransferase